MPDGSVRPDRIRSARPVPDAILVTFESTRDRDAAEGLRGARVEVPRSVLPPPGPGEAYHADMIGCEVRLGGARIGTVARVVSYPTCDALVVQAEPTIEVPLTDAYVAS